MSLTDNPCSRGVEGHNGPCAALLAIVSDIYQKAGIDCSFWKRVASQGVLGVILRSERHHTDEEQRDGLM